MQIRTISSKFLVVLASLMLLGAVRAAGADTITLMWDANPEPAVAGYIVHVGTQPGTYTQHTDVGLSTAYAFSSAVAGQQYCFAVSAYFAGPLESANSNEVCGFSNRFPTLVNPGARTSQGSQATTLQLQGVDPDGQAVTYSATGLPAGLTLQASTGFISGTPTTAGSFAVNVTVSDGVLIASQSFTWTITAPDATAPTVTISGPTSATTYTATTSTLTLSGTAADNVAVTQVTWVNDRGGSGTATGTTSWSAANVALQGGANVLTVTARDAAGNTSSDVLTVTYNVAPVNLAPALTNPGPRSSNLAQATSLQLAGSDPNGDTLTYSVTTLPPGLSLTASNGLIAGTPVMTGSYPVTATVSDGALSASQTFTWTIAPNASASTGAIRLAWDANTETGIAGYIVHAGTQTGIYVQHDDVGLTTTYLFSNAVLGQRYCFTVSAYVAGPVESPRSAEVCGYANMPPTLASVGSQSSNAGQAVTLQLSGSDPEGSAVTYAATGLPAGLAVAPATGLISGTPTTAGSSAVTATVSDGALTASRTFTWTVVSAADATVPTVTITSPTSAATFTTTASTVTVNGTASDNVGVTQVTWTNDRGGSGTASGTTTWNTGAITLQSGVNVLTVTARDAAGNVATDVLTVTLTVAAGDTTAPVIVIDGPTLAATYSATTSTLVLSGTASDNIGVTQVSWVSNRGGSGTASGTTNWTGWSVPLLGGVNILTVTARDAAGNTATDVLTVTRSSAPTLASVANQVTEAGQAGFVQLIGSDADGDVLTYGANGLPPGVALNVSTGVISGTPAETGVYAVTANVFDGSQSASRTFTWTVTADATAPNVTITAPTTAATYASSGTTVTLSGTASDSVGIAQVSWENNRGGSGVAMGTTNWSTGAIVLQSGANVMTVTARDAAGNVTTRVLTVTVNAAPVLASIPNQSAEVGQPVSFQLTGSDPDGDALTATATGLPPGVTLGATTGLLSGVPTVAGTYAVTVTLSDGPHAVLQTFTWTITLETTAPAVAITGPTTASVYATNTTPLTLTGTASDNVGVVQVTWVNNHGGSGTASGTTNWTAWSVPLLSGTNILTVTARDAAGNVATGVLTVTYNMGDVVAPTVEIRTPTSGSSYATAATTLALAGVAADNVGVTRVSWVNSLGGSGSATGTTSWSVSVGLKVGANILTVTARDAAGNTSTDVVTVYRNVAPTLGSVSNRTNRIGQTVSLQLVGADANGDVLTYDATGLPAGLSLDTATGLISGSPTTTGIYAVSVSVSDGSLSKSRTFTWTIKSL